MDMNKNFEQIGQLGMIPLRPDKCSDEGFG